MLLETTTTTAIASIAAEAIFNTEYAEGSDEIGLPAQILKVEEAEGFVATYVFVSRYDHESVFCTARHNVKVLAM